LKYQIDDQLDNAETMVNIQIKNLVEEAGARTNGRARISIALTHG
jgi:hypothetical protein